MKLFKLVKIFMGQGTSTHSKKSILPAFVAVIITAFAVWHAQRPVTPQPATWDDVLAEAGSGGYRIITTEELSERYRKDLANLLLVDTRQEWEYRTGHIAGALNFPMEPTWWSRWRRADDLKDVLGPDQFLVRMQHILPTTE